jgi:hypothetical protein
MRPFSGTVRFRSRRVGGECPGQINLFGEVLPISPMAAPAWQSLPEAARTTLTSLMTRLILDHVRASGIGAGAEDGDDL